MTDFPKIHDFRPMDLSLTCIHPCKRSPDEPPRRCSRVVNGSDRISADTLRSGIMVDDGRGKHVRQLLINYAELCCGKQNHRKNALKLGRCDKVASKWLLELFGHRDGGLTVVPSLPLLQRVLPYESKGRRDTLRDAFSSPLDQQESEDGTLYMIKRVEDPGFVKIGYTRNIADERYKFFESSCGQRFQDHRNCPKLQSVGRRHRSKRSSGAALPSRNPLLSEAGGPTQALASSQSDVLFAGGRSVVCRRHCIFCSERVCIDTTKNERS